MESDATIRDVITRDYVGVSESDTVQGTVELMRAEQASCVLVLRGDDPVGILTEWDVLGVVANGADPVETHVSDVMSSPVESAFAGTPLTEAAGLMSSESIRNLLVEDRETGETLGVLTDRDIIAAVASLQRTRRHANEATTSSEPSRGAPDAEGGLAASGETGATPSNPAGSNGATYVTQGVCEVCGSLSETLYDRNGQLICSDCHEV